MKWGNNNNEGKYYIKGCDLNNVMGRPFIGKGGYKVDINKGKTLLNV